MTITRTFGFKFLPNYVAGTIVEIVHFRDMAFDADEQIAIYLDSVMGSLDLGSFNIAKFPNFDGDETDAEKILLLNKAEASSNKIGLRILKRKNNIGVWDELAEIILVNRGRKDYIDLRNYTNYPSRIVEKNDAIALQLVDYGDGLLWDTDFVSIDFGCTIEIEKKNNLTEITTRLTALENLLNLFGVSTPTAAGTNGLVQGAGVGQQDFLLKGDRTWQNPSTLPVATATTSAINNSIANLVDSSPVALNTLRKLASALGNDPIFATTITNLLAGKVNLTGNETITGSKSFATALLSTNQGLGPPTTTTRSAGCKYVLWNQFSASSCDYAVGMQSASMWFGLPSNVTTNFFQWFGGTTPIATLDGVGNFNIAGSISGVTPSLYGGLNVSGSKGSYSGISFSSGFDAPVFMVANASRISGLWSPSSANGGWHWIYNNGNFQVNGGSANSEGTFLGLFKGLNALPGYPNDRHPTVRTDFANLYFSAAGTFSAWMSTAGVWTASSDYYKKEIIEEEIDSQKVLEKIKHLPVARYHFKSESSEIQRIGTFAQAFWLAFKCGGSDENVLDDSPTSPDKQLAVADVVGICLSGIKGLLDRLEKVENDINSTI